MKYKRKPTVTDAEQFDGRVLLKGMTLNKNYIDPMTGYGGSRMGVRVNGVFHPMDKGDWLLLDCKNNLYPCRDDVFRETWEELEGEGVG
jgi:hypothetical protein